MLEGLIENKAKHTNAYEVYVFRRCVDDKE